MFLPVFVVVVAVSLGIDYLWGEFSNVLFFSQAVFCSSRCCRLTYKIVISQHFNIGIRCANKCIRMEVVKQRKRYRRTSFKMQCVFGAQIDFLDYFLFGNSLDKIQSK